MAGEDLGIGGWLADDMVHRAILADVGGGDKAGADGHLAKPVTMASLFAGITQVLASSEPESEVRAA